MYIQLPFLSADHISHEMEQIGISSGDGDRAWHPHLTLMKIPRPKKFSKQSKFKLRLFEEDEQRLHFQTSLQNCIDG